MRGAVEDEHHEDRIGHAEHVPVPQPGEGVGHGVDRLAAREPQGQPARRHHHPQGHDEGRVREARHEDPRQQPDESARRDPRQAGEDDLERTRITAAQTLFDQARAHHRREGDEAPHREIDPAGEDHERHADPEHRPDRDLLGHVEQVVAGEEGGPAVGLGGEDP